MDAIKRTIITFWLTHIFLRRIGKKYPEFFKRWIVDLTDSRQERRVMELRYTGDTQMKFEAVAIEMNISPRRVFELHKKVVERMVSD